MRDSCSVALFCSRLFFAVVVCVGFLLGGTQAEAANIKSYSNTLSDSGPGEVSNHTLAFTPTVSLAGGSVIEIVPPTGFTINGSALFTRNVELSVGGTVRPATTTAASGIDGVSITPGTPGKIEYELAPDFSIPANTPVELRIGNHTANALQPITTFSTSTGTTTTPGDVEPIENSNTLGRHDVAMKIYNGGQVANAEFVIFLVEKVRMPSVDTTEEIPPFRFNPAPTSTVGGTTISVEISLETDEFAVCKFNTASGTPYAAMPNTFSNTGLIYHSSIVSVTPDSVQRFFVRCIDDEGNFNTDDFVITFAVTDVPTGTANTEGSTSGDGTGSGDDGTGDGSGSGGTTGDSSGEQPLQGGSSGTGGSGGGGGGGSGGSSGSTAGGGFESQDAPFASGDGRVVVSGYAYPDADITILVDGQAAASTQADSDGEYEITLDEIASGAYTFGVYGEDENGVKSSTFSTSFTVSGSRTSALSNINILPSILVEPDPVDIGGPLTITGYALPDAAITIENGITDGSATTLETTSNSDGEWSLTVDTSSFRQGTYQVRARAVQSATRGTNFSDYTFYGVGQDADVPLDADLNRDGSINLIDFSILLFWWASDGGDSSPPADINRDGTVSLTDFSIMLFNWTG